MRSKVSVLMIIEPMKDESEDEHVENFIGEFKVSIEPVKSKSEREEKLRQMMDEKG